MKTACINAGNREVAPREAKTPDLEVHSLTLEPAERWKHSAFAQVCLYIVRITKPMHIIAVAGFHHEHVDCLV